MCLCVCVGGGNAWWHPHQHPLRPSCSVDPITQDSPWPPAPTPMRPEWCKHTYTQACAHTPKHMYPQIGFRANHVSAHASHICFTTERTHMLHEARRVSVCVCVTSGCLVTSQSTRQDSIRSWSATARPSSVTKYIERHYIVGDCVCARILRLDTYSSTISIPLNTFGISSDGRFKIVLWVMREEKNVTRNVHSSIEAGSMEIIAASAYVKGGVLPEIYILSSINHRGSTDVLVWRKRTNRSGSCLSSNHVQALFIIFDVLYVSVLINVLSEKGLKGTPGIM